MCLACELAIATVIATEWCQPGNRAETRGHAESNFPNPQINELKPRKSTENEAPVEDISNVLGLEDERMMKSQSKHQASKL